MKALVTGFDAFGGLPLNPTEEIVKRLAQDKPTDSFEQTLPMVVPTEYARAPSLVIEKIRQESPDMVIMFGLSEIGMGIQLERFALNIVDCEVGDNRNFVRSGQTILDGGPPAYTTAVDLPVLQERLVEAGVSSSISNHAGAYVCNFLYYSVLNNFSEQKKITPAIFIHVPWIFQSESSAHFDPPPLSQHDLTARKILRCLRDMMR